MILDQATLFSVAISITGLLGVFLLLLWRQVRGMEVLAWWGAAYLVGACAVALLGGLWRSFRLTYRTPSCSSPAA